MRTHVQQASILSGRSMTLLAVIGLHALLIAALIAVKIVPPIIQNEVRMQWVKEQPPEIVPPPPQLKPKPAATPIVEVVVPPLVLPADDVRAPEEAIQVAVSEGPADQIEPGPVTESVIPAPRTREFTELDYRAVKSPNDFYPLASISLQEQGIAIVRLCVDGAGRLDGAPTIQSSSGFRRLDQAAVKWAREALRFTPATENGVGVRSCKGFRVVFNLN
jgi:periplasmic protein TonB